MIGFQVVVGRTERGTDLVLDVRAAWHTAIQGMTRSGKSVLTYDILSGLSRNLAVRVVGIDPTGILLNPWRGHPGDDLRSLGTADMGAAAAVLQRIADDMDSRIAGMLGRFEDKIEEFTPDLPLLVVVLEEYPGTLSAAEGWDQSTGAKPADRVAPQIQRNVRRLIQEGAKAGIRVILIAQRMDASIVGGAERSNLGTRITMRVDNADAVKMLHPNISPDVVSQVARFMPGVGIIERPGDEIMIFKADLMSYTRYVAEVRGGVA